MNLTGGRQATGTATLAAVGGLALTVHGLMGDKPLCSFSGVTLVMVALTADTSDERRLLAATQREAQAERSRYLAAKAALVNEQARMSKDIAAERAALTARLKSERDAMQAEFDAALGEVSSDAVNIAMSWVLAGKFAPPQPQQGNLIQFPHQQPQGQPQRERSREHGVVRP
jgi:leucyl aminopeptidase (aminopeptidase T)